MGGRVRGADRRHLRHLQQTQARLLRGPAGAEDDRRREHSLRRGQGAAEEARDQIIV